MQATRYTTTSHDLPTDLDAAHALIARLQQDLATLEYDAAYGLPTRPALERRAARVTSEAAVVYVDLDDLNALNARYGEAAMDARIRAAFAVVRHDDWHRYRSGDEMAALVPLACADAVAARLQDALHRHGLSGSIVVQAFDGGDLATTLRAAATRLQATRRGALRVAPRGWGWRGFIVSAAGQRVGGTFRAPWWARWMGR